MAIHTAVEPSNLLPLGWYAMSGHQTHHGTDVGEDAQLVYLTHHRVHHLALHRPEHDGLVLDLVGDEALPWQYDPVPNGIDGGHGDDEAVLAVTRALHLVEEFLLDCPEIDSLMNCLQPLNSSYKRTHSMRFLPKYFGWSRISFSNAKW